MARDTNGDGWDRYQELVLFRLNEQDVKLNTIDKKVDKLQNFKMRMVGWSAGIAFISSIGMAFFFGR